MRISPLEVERDALEELAGGFSLISTTVSCQSSPQFLQLVHTAERLKCNRQEGQPLLLACLGSVTDFTLIGFGKGSSRVGRPEAAARLDGEKGLVTVTLRAASLPSARRRKVSLLFQGC